MSHRIVVSVENNAYMSWQAKLIHYSCITHLGHAPILVVHSKWETLHPYFEDIRRAGGDVIFAPNYRITPLGTHYPPRNTAGTLLHAEAGRRSGDDFFVLCDADMLFLAMPAFPKTLSGNQYEHMNFLGNHWVRAAAAALGVPFARIEERHETLCCGVPHVVPAEDAHRLGQVWLNAIDACQDGVDWCISMYAFGLAVSLLDLPVERTDYVNCNHLPDQPPSKPILHYSYGDHRWVKTMFDVPSRTAEVWDSPAACRDKGVVPGSMLDVLLRQIEAARDYYIRLGCHSQIEEPWLSRY